MDPRIWSKFGWGGGFPRNSYLLTWRIWRWLKCPKSLLFVNNAIFTLSFILLYLFYFLFLPRMPGNSLVVEVSQYLKKKKKNNIMKVYIESKNMQVQLIQFRNKYRLFDVETLKRETFASDFFTKLGSLLSVTCRYCSRTLVQAITVDNAI